MKKFRFRLQRVLDAKESEEKQQQRRLGEALEQVVKAENRLDELFSQLSETRKRQAEMVSGSMKAGEAMMMHNWQMQLKKEVSAQRQDLVKLNSIAEKIRNELLELSKEKRVLEKLREKQWEEYKKQDLTAQQNMLDDIGNRNANGQVQQPLG